jgi:Domain of unknown function (DUF4129)
VTPPSAGRVGALVLVASVAFGCAAPAPADDTSASSSKPAGRWQDASLEHYREHLVVLQGLTQACAKARNVTSCDPTRVGPDDRIPTGQSANAERRLVRYGWLRILFSRAEEPDQAQQATGAREPPNPANRPDQSEPPVRPEQATTSQLLEDARVRLARDLEQAGSVLAEPPPHNQEREVMKQVLAGREFRDLKQPTTRDTALERFGNWLNRMFAKVDRLRSRSPWVGRALIWGVFLVIGIGLAMGLMRIERRWRVRLVSMSERPAPEAVSARDWQLWLTDARKAADAGLWREAIHFLYWAAISRLESKRLWPADRARTPREYLALVAPEDPRRHSLASLTRTFERTWYGGRQATEDDYRATESLAADLISGTGAGSRSAAVRPPVAAEGGVA